LMNAALKRRAEAATVDVEMSQAEKLDH